MKDIPVDTLELKGAVELSFWFQKPTCNFCLYVNERNSSHGIFCSRPFLWDSYFCDKLILGQIVFWELLSISISYININYFFWIWKNSLNSLTSMPSSTTFTFGPLQEKIYPSGVSIMNIIDFNKLVNPNPVYWIYGWWSNPWLLSNDELTSLIGIAVWLLLMITDFWGNWSRIIPSLFDY